MLNEELMILICKELDEKLNHLKKFNQRFIDYGKNQKEYKEFHEKFNRFLVEEISKNLGVGSGDVGKFYESPSFKVQLNAENFEKNTMASCFYAAPTESIIRVMNANYDVLELDEEKRKLAEECDLKMIIKTTRTKIFNKTYSVTERILNAPGKAIADACDAYFASDRSEVVEVQTADLSEAARDRIISDESKKYIWEKFKQYSYAGPFNNTLVNYWYDYKKFFKDTYGEEFNELDANRLSLWQNDGYILLDNRKIDHKGETVSLEEQFKLSLRK